MTKDIDIAARKEWLGLLARSSAQQVAMLWEGLGQAPDHQDLRPPEIGAAMVRGRAGGTGAAFNVGEITITRCSVRLGCGAVGHGYVQGRDKSHARIAALTDALMQTDAAPDVEAGMLTPLRHAAKQAKDARATRAAATKVDFFTMVRGED